MLLNCPGTLAFVWVPALTWLLPRYLLHLSQQIPKVPIIHLHPVIQVKSDVLAGAACLDQLHCVNKWVSYIPFTAPRFGTSSIFIAR